MAATTLQIFGLDNGLQRRVQLVAETNPREKPRVFQLINAFIEREQLRSAEG